jgi:GT2 family glycosyltransferase
MGRALTADATDPFVSVIIPHFNDLDGLKLCLSALERQTYPADRFEIIVADNASPQGVAAVEAVAQGRAKVLLVEERGAGPARNGAVAQSFGEILAFIDSDCVAEPAWLSEGVQALDAYDFVGGQVKVLVDDESHMTPAEAFERVFAFDFKSYIEKKGFTGAGNLFCHTALFAAVGGFGVGISEDTEWSKRAQVHGYRLGYAPMSVVGHPARRTRDELIRKWKRINRESYALSSASKGGRLRWGLRALALPASALVHTPRVLLTPKLNHVGQRWQALCMLYSLRLWRVWDTVAVLMEDRRRRSGELQNTA